jgi:hypothetical protein
MPHHSVWSHRLVATCDTAQMPDHRFSLSTDAEAEHAATIVRTWLAGNLPRMRSWLGDFDVMLAAVEEDRERAARARAEQLASGRWKVGSWPDGIWNDGIIRAYAHAERGDVDSVLAETAGWHDTGPDSLAADAVALASRRLSERQG